MLTAERFGYRVIQWSFGWDPSLADLLREAPEVVLGMRIAITSCDSGPYKPSPQDMTAGWMLDGSTALSPVVESISDLPMPGFDEWYVFDRAPVVYPRMSYVNQYGFSPLELDNEEAKGFWTQIEKVQPLHALGAGTPNMFLVTRDKASFERMKRFDAPRDAEPAGRQA